MPIVYSEALFKYIGQELCTIKVFLYLIMITLLLRTLNFRGGFLLIPCVLAWDFQNRNINIPI